MTTLISQGLRTWRRLRAKTMSSYLQTIAIDKQAVTLILLLQSGKPIDRSAITLKLYNTVLPITKDEVLLIVRRLNLPNDVREDMEQDAFIKLLDIVPKFDSSVCPVFTTFWRKSLGNHLLTRYKKYWRTTAPVIERTFDDTSTEDNLFLDDIRESYEEKLKDQQLPVYFGILRERVLCDKSSRTRQSDLADRFEVTQGYVSRIEQIIRKKLKHDFPGILDK